LFSSKKKGEEIGEKFGDESLVYKLSPDSAAKESSDTTAVSAMQINRARQRSFQRVAYNGLPTSTPGDRWDAGGGFRQPYFQ